MAEPKASERSSNTMTGKGRPGGPGANKVAGSGDRNPIRKSRPKSELGSIQSTGVKGSDRDPIRKSRPKGSGSGQSTNTK
jgi:hypothetical protein